jgi:integrase
LDSEALTSIRKREAKRAAENAEQTKRERAEALVRQEELITKWRAGQYSGCLYDVPTMLRIDGDEVVTSRGARFPVSHAKRALAFVRKVCESRQAYVRNGHAIHLGPYTLDRIEADGTVKAGCHAVSWEEIERIASAFDSVPTSATAINPTVEVQS